MPLLKKRAKFDTAGIYGFDKGGMDFDLETTYTLKIYDTSDVKVAEIAGDLENTTLTELVFKTNQKGGCGDFSFTLADKHGGINADALLPGQTSGQILSLNGSGYASIADGSQAGLDMGYSDFMIEAWIKTSSTAKQGIIYKSGAGGYYDFHINATTGYLECVINDGTNTATITGDIAVNDGDWHYVVVAIDKSSATGGMLFVDRTEDISARTDVTSVTDIDNDGAFYVGYDGTDEFVGQIEEVRVWHFGKDGLPVDYANYISWLHDNPHAALSEYDSDAWAGYADADRTEILTDPGIENWTGDTPDDWTEEGESAGIRDITDEGVEIHGGSHAAKLEATNNDGTIFAIKQSPTLTANKYYEMSMWSYFASRTAGNIIHRLHNDTDGDIIDISVSSVDAAYTRRAQVVKPTIAAHDVFFYYNTETTTGITYVDDISVKRVGLVAHYKFNGDYTDETSNGNDLTAGGTGNTFPEYSEIAYNYKVEIYLFNHFSPWFTGYLSEVPEAGTDKIQNYAGYGYFEKFNKKLITNSFTAQEISAIATSVLDDDIIANYPAITKNTDKIEATGYTLAGTLQFERQFARDVFSTLADVANDYEFGVDHEGEFFFRAIDTTILERFWVGKHITEFTPGKDYTKIVNRWYIYAPPFSDGSNYQIMVENAASQSSYGLAEDYTEAPEIINLYSSTNLASGITPTTSPVAGTPANMTDGDNSTLWESGANQTIGHYIKIDLGAEKSSVAKVVLDSINVSAQEYHAALLKIETSTDDVTYTEVFSASSDPGWKPTITFEPVAARYILITLTAAASVHWKVGEVEVYELDTTDLERWGAQVLTDSKDPILRAEGIVRGIDKVISKRPIVAPIFPTGKCRIIDTDGTTTHDYAIISCEYSLSSSGIDLTMELGSTKPEPSDWIRKLRRQIAGDRLLGIRTGSNIASGTGMSQGTIDQTIIKAGSIETPHLKGNKISLHGGLVELGQAVMSGGGHGFVVKDANGYYRFEAGKLNDDYGVTLRDATNVITVDEGAVMGAAQKEYVSASNTINTTSTTYTDMTTMTITTTFPKCIVFIWGAVFLDTTGLSSGDCEWMFYIDSGTIGLYSGAEMNRKIVTNNQWCQSLAAGSHTIKIQWKSNAAGQTSTTWNRHLGVIYWEVQ